MAFQSLLQRLQKYRGCMPKTLLRNEKDELCLVTTRTGPPWDRAVPALNPCLDKAGGRGGGQARA